MRYKQPIAQWRAAATYVCSIRCWLCTTATGLSVPLQCRCLMSSLMNRTEVRYTETLRNSGTMLAETRILLLAWRLGEDRAAFEERVLREDLLGRATARRVHDMVRIFMLRFLTPVDAPAQHLRTLLAADTPRQLFTDLVFYYTVRR